MVVAYGAVSLGIAPVATIAADLVVSGAPVERAGAASALNETSSEFGGALGIALLGSILTAVYRVGLGGALPDSVPIETAALALRGIGGAYSAAGTMTENGNELLEAARAAYADAMLATVSVSAAIIVAAALASLVMFRRRPVLTA